jgi:hypothetical protein
MAVPISNVVRRIVFAPSGVGPYAFTFEILAATDIEVYKGDTLLTLTTDYTVSINSNGTGSVTLVLTAGTDNITIVGARTIQRTTDFVTGGDLFANSLNEELDSLTIFTQQNAEASDRSVRAPVTDPTTIDMTLPVKADRAGKYLSFNSSTGDPEVVNTVVDVTAVAANAANINTVAGISANVTSVAGNASNINTVAGISGNVTTVAGIAANVTTVAGISADVTTVAADGTDIGAVAAISADVQALGPIAADITTVAGIDSDVTAVAADATDIGTVATNIANVNTVAGISADVTTVAGDSADIQTVAGIDSDITTVAGIAANVTTVAGISANVTTVAGISADVTTVATNVADITNFSDVYLGPAATDPATRNDSSALQAGDLYFNTVDDAIKVYTGSAWVTAYITADGFVTVADAQTITGVKTFDNGLNTDTISEETSAAGVTVDGVILKDSQVSTDQINEKTSATGVTVDGVLLKDSGVVTGAGTVSAPVYSTTGDLNTGIFFPAADTIGFAEGGAEAMRIDSSGRVGIGTTAPAAPLEVLANSSNALSLRVRANASNFGVLRFASNDGNTVYSQFDSRSDGFLVTNVANIPMVFATNDTERVRIDSSGRFMVGTTSTTPVISNTFGLTIGAASDGTAVAGAIQASANGSAGLLVNRGSDDGNLVLFYQAGTNEGSISVSGSTVSYNGGHLSRWAQMLTKPDLLKGTVMSNLDEMNVYVDADGNPVENEQLNKVKVSDVEGDPNVAGVFVNWTYDEAHQVDEINMAMTGDMIIRIAQGVTVARGDLLMSAGDGTAKPQGDDIVRSKTIAKVTSTHVTCTYDDGSYCVPCVLMAC